MYLASDKTPPYLRDEMVGTKVWDLERKEMYSNWKSLNEYSTFEHRKTHFWVFRHSKLLSLQLSKKEDIISANSFN